ncbi:ABC transporter permease [Comamonas serinivorans]|uniref:ABC transporter permease n=1 Tax=Comamonas serinivorans TaxID=1082851 RepID=A0A1Y0EIE4_9BURK|nr:ABC transporter permease [Comamonas serinivorans]ARU03377.1 ABC transporter permease [Comamonas serinivorans]
MPSDPAHLPRVDLSTSSQAGAVVLGEWTSAQLTDAKRWAELQARLHEVAGQLGSGRWALTPQTQLDHLGAQALLAVWGAVPATLEATEDQRAVLARVAGFSAPQLPAKPAVSSRLLQNLSKGWRERREMAGDAVALLGQLVLDLGKLIRAPKWGPWSDFSSHLYNIGGTALPITALVGFLIGVVLAYLMSQVLRQFGAEVFIVNILGLALIRELGPILASVLIAGRSGSSITAQIGVMRVTEELDAMRVMGIPVNYRLVMPRVLALAVAMPLVTIWTTAAALLGGMLAAWITLDLSPTYFLTAMPSAVSLPNLLLAIGKSAVFGVAIAMIACFFGLRVAPNTESLGRGTTSSVVTAITAVILIDAVFAIAFKSVGI